MPKKTLERLTPYLFLAPCAVLLAVILIYPVGAGILKSFFNENLMVPNQNVRFVGAENFLALFRDRMFLHALWRSVSRTLVILAIEMGLGTAFALLLNTGIFAKKFFRCLVLIPWIIPNAIVGITWKWFLNESYGMLNFLLKSFGLAEHNLPWLSDNHLAAGAIVFVIAWKHIPFVAITLLAGLQAIPQNLYESARVDGAGAWACFRYVTVPMMKKIATITAVLISIWNFNHLDVIQVVTRGGPGEATLTLPVYIYRLFMQTFQTSYASAAAVVMMGILIVPASIYVRKLLKG